MVDLSKGLNLQELKNIKFDKKVLKKYKNVIVYVSVFIIVFLLARVVFIGPGRNRVESLKKSIKEERSKNDLKTELLAIEKRVNQASKGLAKGRGILDVMDEVTDIARGANIKFKNIKPAEERVYGAYNGLAVEVIFESSFEELADFIDKIESHSNMLKIEKAKVKTDSRYGRPRPDQVKELGKATVILEIVSYF